MDNLCIQWVKSDDSYQSPEWAVLGNCPRLKTQEQSGEMHLWKYSPQTDISAARAYRQLDVSLWFSPSLIWDVPYRQIVSREGHGHRSLLAGVHFNIDEAFEHRWRLSGRWREVNVELRNLWHKLSPAFRLISSEGTRLHKTYITTVHFAGVLDRKGYLVCWLMKPNCVSSAADDVTNRMGQTTKP